jgi:DNA invertase Pin-like site-specific DNA recombinase
LRPQNKLLMLLVKTANRAVKPTGYHAPAEPTLEDAVRSLHQAGISQRAIARELNVDRRKVKRVLDHVA